MTPREVAETTLASLSAKAERTPLSVCETRLLRQVERTLRYGERWPTTNGPRDCCAVSPETESGHGHGPTEPDLYGEDDVIAAAALLRRALESKERR